MSIKVAFIPPKGWHRYMGYSTGMQMAIALSDLTDTPSYIEAFREAKEAGDYVILDNGALEGDLSSSKRIKAFAKVIGADEIALPDVLGDVVATRDAARQYLRLHDEGTDRRYMGIVQGTTPNAIRDMVAWYHDQEAIGTIGIPRDMISRLGQKHCRIDLANWIANGFPRFEVHMLGASSAWPEEVRYIAKYSPTVRSIDTSMPFNYSIQNKQLDKGGMAHRQAGYFSGALPIVNETLIQHNLNTYLNWAAGE